MINCKDSIYNTIATIEYSDEYESNWDLFNHGIEILKRYDCMNQKDFSNDDREVLEEIFTIISS